jgi:DUF4097 and DUF4098 domain-containing protein YvlB
MENRNRNLWIILIVVAVLLCLCAAIVIAVIATGAIFTVFPVSREGGLGGRVTESAEQSYPVGQAPLLEVDNFAGNVTVHVGESGQIRAVVAKNARSRAELERINVEWKQRDNGLRIRTSRSSTLMANQSVDLEIFVPADAELALDTGAGNIEVDGVQGEIQAHTGAGNIEVQGPAGPVNLDSGAGNIDYAGVLHAECTFDTGAGNITLQLPAAISAEVDLQTGIGNIDLGGFDVQGETSRTEVRGTIGTGEQATIEAHTGAGNIDLVRR